MEHATTTNKLESLEQQVKQQHYIVSCMSALRPYAVMPRVYSALTNVTSSCHPNLRR